MAEKVERKLFMKLTPSKTWVWCHIQTTILQSTRELKPRFHWNMNGQNWDNWLKQAHVIKHKPGQAVQMTSEFVDGSWQVGTTPAQDEPQKSAVTPWDEGTRIYGSQAFES